jgi:hypothetical protein
MWLTNICVDAERIRGKITPALENIAHNSFNRKAALPVNRAPQILGNILVRPQSQQLAANLAVSIPALLDAAGKDCSDGKSSQVI